MRGNEQTNTPVDILRAVLAQAPEDSINSTVVYLVKEFRIVELPKVDTWKSTVIPSKATEVIPDGAVSKPESSSGSGVGDCRVHIGVVTLEMASLWFEDESEGLELQRH